MMHFRDHPLLKRGNVNSWPPVWLNTNANSKKVLHGEVGILRDIIANRFTGNRCILIIESDDKERYVGTLFIGDPAFCFYVTKFLQSFVGKSVRSIGESDISASL
jgi:hypothetical protein